MFGKILDETLGKITFWLFFFGFHLTFFIQHFLGLMGMPRRVFTFKADQGWDLSNLISSIGAAFMALATIVLVINIVKTALSKQKVAGDAWGYGRTLEWSIPSPPPEYNFKQTPLVRGLDPLWVEKMEGKKGMTPAEPVGDIHMPNGSIIPFFISFGLFVAAFGVMYRLDHAWGLPVMILGLVITFGAMFFRSIIDDHGYHIHKEDLLAEDDDKGAKL
jgi:cytochrome c oxidase subunit 1